MKTFTMFGSSDCYFAREGYIYGGGLAIEIHSLREGPIAKLTTNIVPLPKPYAFLDTNNCPGAEELVVRLGIAKDRGARVRSGFCVYPLYEFDLKKLEEYVMEEEEEEEE